MIVASRPISPLHDQGFSAIHVAGLVGSIRQGLSIHKLRHLAAPLHLTQTESIDTLHIPRRTLAQCNTEGVLSREESEKTLRFARITTRTFAVFETQDQAVCRLKSPNPPLQGEMPLSLMGKSIGEEMVMDLLGRIKHGVFA